jgi:hypothetical protein
MAAESERLLRRFQPWRKELGTPRRGAVAEAVTPWCYETTRARCLTVDSTPLA